jgi:hypothetical protein
MAKPPPIDPFGPTQHRVVTRQKVASSSFTLSDGTRIKVKPKIGDVRRALNQFNTKGQPLYFMTLGYDLETIAPQGLLKKAKKPRRKPRKRR